MSKQPKTTTCRQLVKLGKTQYWRYAIYDHASGTIKVWYEGATA
jgi:hypothetical protein